jgi:hypothetical protein
MLACARRHFVQAAVPLYRYHRLAPIRPFGEAMHSRVQLPPPAAADVAAGRRRACARAIKRRALFC